MKKVLILMTMIIMLSSCWLTLDEARERIKFCEEIKKDYEVAYDGLWLWDIVRVECK